MIILGYDIGQVRDPSALVALRFSGETWTVAAAETLPLGMPYAEQVGQVRRAAENAAQQSGQRVVVAVDRTGNRDTADRVIESMPAVAITITAGRRANGGWPYWSIPKPLLAHAFARALESGLVRLPPRGRNVALRRELESMVRKPGGKLEAAGAGHDDQALALMLAYWTGMVLREPARWQRWEVRGGSVIAT